MVKYKMLILTDHSGHSKENSIYALAKAARLHPQCAQLDIATRANTKNDPFFKEFNSEFVYASKVEATFAYDAEGSAYTHALRKVCISDYEVVWLRLPPPLSKSFLDMLSWNFPKQVFINDPVGIYETGTKAFLLNFQDCCPPMKHCKSIEDIIEFKHQFPIVLKPLREYGGKGIVRIDGDQVWQGKTQISWHAFVDQQRGSAVDYIGVKFLKNVSEGDKRIVVVNGEVLGASLRLPAKDSWLCNVSMGGSSNPAEVTPEEHDIIASIHPKLANLGIVMYGVDTLVDDDGRRVLSEINTTSIGGIAQIGALNGVPVVEHAIDLIWNYIINKKSAKDVIGY